jgi:hypothetical protein
VETCDHCGICDHSTEDCVYENLDPVDGAVGATSLQPPWSEDAYNLRECEHCGVCRHSTADCPRVATCDHCGICNHSTEDCAYDWMDPVGDGPASSGNVDPADGAADSHQATAGGTETCMFTFRGDARVPRLDDDCMTQVESGDGVGSERDEDGLSEVSGEVEHHPGRDPAAGDAAPGQEPEAAAGRDAGTTETLTGTPTAVGETDFTSELSAGAITCRPGGPSGPTDGHSLPAQDESTLCPPCDEESLEAQGPQP